MLPWEESMEGKDHFKVALTETNWNVMKLFTLLKYLEQIQNKNK